MTAAAERRRLTRRTTQTGTHLDITGVLLSLLPSTRTSSKLVLQHSVCINRPCYSTIGTWEGRPRTMSAAIEMTDNPIRRSNVMPPTTTSISPPLQSAPPGSFEARMQLLEKKMDGGEEWYEKDMVVGNTDRYEIPYTVNTGQYFE